MVEVLERMGGVATRGALIRATSRAAVDAALAGGEVVVLARGRYALAAADHALKAAHRLTGVASHESAALHHGWAVLHTPKQPHVSRRLAEAADPRAANPFESALRGIALEVAGLSVSPQQSKQTPSSGTAAATPWLATPAATTSSSSTAGWC